MLVASSTVTREPLPQWMGFQEVLTSLFHCLTCRYRACWQNYHCVILDKKVSCSAFICSVNDPNRVLPWSFPTLARTVHSTFPHTAHRSLWHLTKILDVFKYILRLRQLSSKSLPSFVSNLTNFTTIPGSLDGNHHLLRRVLVLALEVPIFKNPSNPGQTSTIGPHRYSITSLNI